MEKFLKYAINVEQQEPTKNYGKYVISPLEKGFGNTIGNALRRVLLSAIPGAAAFAIRIPGVTHEYQSIPGVREDVTAIVLNVKNLVIAIDENVYSDEELAKIPLENWPVIKVSKSSGEITGADLECPAGISIVNKNIRLATIEGKGKLELHIFATRSRGFKTFQENREKVSSAGVIAIDSNFSPVVKVAYSVDEVKTARRGTSDQLTIELATNGALSPSDSLALSAKILAAHLEPIVAINERIQELAVLREKEAEEKSAVLSIPIEDLGVTMRSYNGLKRYGIQTIAELITKSRSEVAKIKNLGKKSVKEIAAKLAERNLSLRED